MKTTFDPNNNGSSKRACSLNYFGLAHFLACVHDSAPISRPIFIKCVRYSLFQVQEQVLSTMQPETILCA